jgi:hypothetical protein
VIARFCTARFHRGESIRRKRRLSRASRSDNDLLHLCNAAVNSDALNPSLGMVKPVRGYQGCGVRRAPRHLEPPPAVIPRPGTPKGVIMLEGNKSHSKISRSTVPACGLGFAGAAIALFQLFARDLFPPLPGGEFNADRNLAAVIFAVFAGIAGIAVGSLIDRLRRGRSDDGPPSASAHMRR